MMAKFSNPTPTTLVSGVTLLAYAVVPIGAEPSEVESTGTSNSIGLSTVTGRLSASTAAIRRTCWRMCGSSNLPLAIRIVGQRLAGHPQERPAKLVAQLAREERRLVLRNAGVRPPTARPPAIRSATRIATAPHTPSR
ncbi:hypothetical protein AB0F42_19290 [Streptomyces buecherae]|uniref:hypothetical protein n=1 Tax=Streptomyces buecherae TaxID=2763006 RepID=UPI0033ECFCFF